MRGSVFKRLQLCVSNLRNLSNLRTLQSTQLQFLQQNASYIAVKPFSCAAKDELLQSFLVSYLINSCRLSSERAVSVCLRYGHVLKFNSPEKPDSVLTFFRNHGFTDAFIPKVVSSDPSLLLVLDPEKTLLPKLEFFYSTGFTKQDLPHFISKNPTFLRRSVRDHVIPLYLIIKSVIQSDAMIVAMLKRAGWGLQRYVNRDLGPNITYLKELGVPNSKIAFLLRGYPGDLMLKHAEFRKIVNEALELGIDKSTTVFVLAVHAGNKCYKSTRDHFSKIYKEWGWSDEDVILSFRKHPGCMLFSEKKLTRTLDFLINKMGCQAGAIIKCPFVLFCSLERTIIPRCLVIQVLLAKGLIKKDWSLASVVLATEKCFLKRFVTKYHNISPQLLSVYQLKVDPSKKCSAKINEMKQP